jgi:hypothetical protein
MMDIPYIHACSQSHMCTQDKYYLLIVLDHCILNMIKARLIYICVE